MSTPNTKKMAKDAQLWANSPEGKREMREAIEAAIKRANKLKEERRFNMERERSVSL